MAVFRFATLVIADVMTTNTKLTNPNFIFFSSLVSVKIGIFYSIFYAALAALVAMCMWVFFQTLDPRIPKWKLKESLIGTNPGTYQPADLPNYLIIIFKESIVTLWQKKIDLYFLGLGFRPMPPPENVESTLIWYKGTNLENYRQWTDALDKFLASM